METTLRNDRDPIRTVLLSIRPEFYKPTSDVAQAALIVRYDKATLTNRRWLLGRRGVILRANDIARSDSTRARRHPRV